MMTSETSVWSAVLFRATLTRSTILQLILFADDTNVFVSHKDKDCLTNILNAELNKLSIWFRANRLSSYIGMKISPVSV